jgi:thiol-disulfide isomerase/thioredoxin
MDRVRVRAPELRGRGWLNTGGRPITLADLRGRIAILDFWTFCCINCLHVLDELRPLEDKYADVLVVIGVHSPKFEHEKDPAALAAAVERYGVSHPVLDDPSLDMWQQYTAKAWPTLTVIDPEGYVVASMAGEGHAEGLARLIDELIAEHDRKGTLRRGDGPYVPPEPPPTVLRFPGKAIAIDDGLLVADSAHHSLAVLDSDLTEKRRIGSGTRGRADGTASGAQFNEPGGLCRLPAAVAEVCGYDLVVADTVNHMLRGVRLDSGEVLTVAGSGRPWRSTVDFKAHDALAADLSSPWDVAWYDDRVIVAMAGIHQLWWFDPVKRTTGAYAGSTVEALRDGPLREAWFAQPSGLSAAGDKLWIADSESSALRYISAGEVHTVVGQGLFDFGHVDGPAADALLQHPLGVLALANGDVLVADTYNGAVRRYSGDSVETVATGLAEPSDLVQKDGHVLVVESAAHRLTPLHDVAGSGRPVGGSRMRTERPATTLAPGAVRLEVIFEPPPGQKLDTSFGPATRLSVSASPPELLAAGVGVGNELSRVLRLRPGEGVLQVTAQAATCDADAGHPACHLTRQDWGVPVRVADGGGERLPLVLRGMDPGPLTG